MRERDEGRRTESADERIDDTRRLAPTFRIEAPVVWVFCSVGEHSLSASVSVESDARLKDVFDVIERYRPALIGWVKRQSVSRLIRRPSFAVRAVYLSAISYTLVVLWFERARTRKHEYKFLWVNYHWRKLIASFSTASVVVLKCLNSALIKTLRFCDIRYKSVLFFKNNLWSSNFIHRNFK